MTSTHTNPHSLAAIVLAAGASSRMGKLKPLMRLAGTPALARSIALFREAGIDDVVVVLGNRAEEIRPLVRQYAARCVDNPDWNDGMYSSVAAGARALPASARGVFVLPADIPLVRPATVRRLVAASLAHPDAIVYPVFDNRRGHPPLIPRAILDRAAHGAPGPLCALLDVHDPTSIEVPVPDEAIHLDMDTPDDFFSLLPLIGRRDVPTAAECEALLAMQNVPEPVLRHMRAVADVAGSIADALIAAGLAIDSELIQAGALLHDLAKGRPKHAEAGAAILRDLGMPAVAAIVAVHMEMHCSGVVDERAIVYLADKLVSGDRLVTLHERFAPAHHRFRGNPEALAAARRRESTAESIAAAIEARLGAPLDSILHDPPKPRKRDASAVPHEAGK